MPRYLAIDVDSHGLYVAAGNVSRGKTLVDKVAFAPVDAALSPGSAQGLGRQLKDLLKQAGIAPAPVLVCLARDKIILKDVVHPPTSGPEEPVIVRYQAVKDLANDADEMELDYLPTGETTDGQKTALAVFARKDAVSAAKVFCEAAGLKMHGLTPRPFAAAAAAMAAVAAGVAEPTDDPTDPVAVLTLTDTGGEFTVARAGRVLFTKAVPTQAVQSEAVLISEVRRNLAVFAGAAGGDPARAVYVAEAGPPEAGWTFRLAAGLPVPVHRFDPLAGTPIGDEVPAPSRGRFTGAVGLLALAAAGPTLPINYISPRQPKAAANKSRTRVLIAALAAGVLIAGGGVFAYLKLDEMDGEIAALKDQSLKLDTAIKSSEEDQNRLQAAEEFVNHNVAVQDELYEASVKFPNITQVRLTQFEFESSKLPDEKTRERLARREAKAKPTPAPVPGKKPAAGPPPIPPPAGKITLHVSTADSNLVDTLVKHYVDDGKRGLVPGYYQNTKQSQAGAGGGAVGGGGRNAQAQFVVTANVSPRKPAEYRNKLSVTAPAAAAAPPVVDPDDSGNPIGNEPVAFDGNREDR